MQTVSTRPLFGGEWPGDEWPGDEANSTSIQTPIGHRLVTDEADVQQIYIHSVATL